MTHDEKLKLARRTYVDYGAREAVEAGYEQDETWRNDVLTGKADSTHGVKIALAAIEATEARVVEMFGKEISDWKENGGHHQVVYGLALGQRLIKSGAHHKEAGDE